MAKKSLAELEAELLEHDRKLVGCIVTHAKSGGRYIVTDVHYREADMSLEVTYETFDYDRIPVKFSRPLGEFMDGRFQFDGGRRPV